MWLSNIIVHRVFKNFDFRMTARVYDSLHNIGLIIVFSLQIVIHVFFSGQQRRLNCLFV